MDVEEASLRIKQMGITEKIAILDVTDTPLVLDFIKKPVSGEENKPLRENRTHSERDE